MTPDVVRIALRRLGPSTAGAVAAEITRVTGHPVNGRAVRFMAEHAGATVESVDGERRYSLPA